MDLNKIIKNAPRQGWREFDCYECGHIWEAKTRDCYSPSQEICPKCNSGNQPMFNRLDLTLKVDKWGNLE